MKSPKLLIILFTIVLMLFNLSCMDDNEMVQENDKESENLKDGYPLPLWEIHHRGLDYNYKANIWCVRANENQNFLSTGCGSIKTWEIVPGVYPPITKNTNGDYGEILSADFADPESLYPVICGSESGILVKYGFDGDGNLIEIYRYDNPIPTQYPFHAIAVNPTNSNCILSASYDKIEHWHGYDNTYHLIETYNGEKHHTGYVWTLDFSSDGIHFVSGGFDNKVVYWDVNIKDGIANLGSPGTAHSDRVRCVKINPARSFILSGGNDKKLKVWSLLNYSLVRSIQLETFYGNISCMVLSDYFVFYGSDDGFIRRWNYNGGVSSPIIGWHDGPVHSVDFIRIGSQTYIISSGADGYIKCWNIPL